MAVGTSRQNGFQNPSLKSHKEIKKLETVFTDIVLSYDGAIVRNYTIIKPF